MTYWIPRIFVIALAAFAVWTLIRVSFVGRARLHFINSDDLWERGDYHRLPTFDEMMYAPAYWGIWTKKQWVSWVRERVEV